METIKIDILNPNALNLLNSLAKLNLTIFNLNIKPDFSKLLKKM